MKVLSNTGFEKFSGIRKTIHESYYKVTFITGEVIKCTDHHIFESINGPIYAKDLTKYDELYRDTNSTTFIKTKRKVNKELIAYDLIDVGSSSLYYTNNILSHNCSFLGSSNTLITASKLQQLVHLDPILVQPHLYVYDQPQPGRIYITTVDVGAGLSMDYSVINIVDVTEAPYKQVLVYRNNDIDPSSFSIVVESIARKYNNSYLIIESNNDGKIVARELFDSEYDNLINTKSQDGDNQIKSGRRSVPGIMMTKSTKRTGCTKLKDLIESNVLIITNEHTISELGNFVLTKGSYAAESGKHDDIVLCLVMFAWFSNTDYFTDVTGVDTMSKVRDNRNDDDLYTLLGFIDDGYAEEFSGFNF